MSGAIVIVFVGVLVAVGSLAWAVAGALSGPRQRLQKRADGVRRRRHGDSRPGAAAAVTSVKRVEAKSRLAVADRLAKRLLPRQSVLQARLARTGRNIPVGTYLLANLGLAAGAFAAAMVFELPMALAALGAVVVGVGIPHWVIGRMAARRLRKFTLQFPEAIDLIVRGLKSGLPATESIAAVGREMTDPVGGEFRRISDSVTFGQELDDALWEAATRLGTPEFKFFVISLVVQRETGGNLGETLANLSDILRRRRQMELKVRAMSSEGRASANVLGALPIIMFGLLYLLNPEYQGMLLWDPRGRMLLGSAAMTMGMGMLVMRKMVRFEI